VKQQRERERERRERETVPGQKNCTEVTKPQIMINIQTMELIKKN
jgi:hypothetical protein